MKTFFSKIVPIVFILALVSLLGAALLQHTEDRPAPMVGEELPNFHLSNIFHPSQEFTPKDFKGQVVLLNVWATWCYACQVEHPTLVSISKNYAVPIYGVNYRDNAAEARAWLEKEGNPYRIVGADPQGDLTIDLGVYGTPETFIIDKHGKIRYRHVGVITQKEWDNVLWPMVQQYKAE